MCYCFSCAQYLWYTCLYCDHKHRKVRPHHASLGPLPPLPSASALPHDCASLPKQWPLHKTNKIVLLPRAARRYVSHQRTALHATEDNLAHLAVFTNANKAEMLHHPCILADPQTKGDKIRFGYLTLAFSGAQKRADPQTKGDKIRSGYLTPAFLGAQKRAKMIHHSSILGDPQTKGDKIRIGCLTPAFSGAEKKGGSSTSPLHCR